MAKVLKFATVVGDSASLALSSAKFSSSLLSLINARNTRLLLSPCITLRLSPSFIPIRCQRSPPESEDNNSATQRDLTIPSCVVERLKRQLTQNNEEIQKLKASIDSALEHLDKIPSTTNSSSQEGCKGRNTVHF
ncbi:uncharacterized protein LOC123230104 [Mangifera indica]|uniref:uncharacterized protein LOC123230104 n=1 Tax=Mangifera indica TaxID=29780 RepID=UPI001CF9DBD7|nr:uncharacterized protein LOC123230104 [Mangifera indica]